MKELKAFICYEQESYGAERFYFENEDEKTLVILAPDAETALRAFAEAAYNKKDSIDMDLAEECRHQILNDGIIEAAEDNWEYQHEETRDRFSEPFEYTNF